MSQAIKRRSSHPTETTPALEPRRWLQHAVARTVPLVGLLISGSLSVNAATLFPEGVNLHFASTIGNDIAYNKARDELYATVGSSVGFPNGNSIVTLNRRTGAIVDSQFAGSEPGQIAISKDGSRTYIGNKRCSVIPIMGARNFNIWRSRAVAIQVQ